MSKQTGFTILPTVESEATFHLRSRQSPHHDSTKTAFLSARVVGLAALVQVSTEAVSKLADGGHSVVGIPQSVKILEVGK